MQEQILLGECLAPVVRAHCHHHRVAIPVPSIRILYHIPLLWYGVFHEHNAFPMQAYNTGPTAFRLSS